VSAPAAPSRLRELRIERGWTQQDVADRLVQLAWTRLREPAAVNADMVAKWERGVKGVSPRYRKLLAALFGVTVDQLGLPGATSGRSPSLTDDQSLVAMVDNAAELLNELGGAGRVVRTQVLAALTDEVLTRRSVFAMLDTTALVTAATPSEATLADLESLAERYETAHATVTPAALMTAVSAHLRTLTDALRADLSAGMRQRMLRNRARVAVLAGRLAADDLGNVMAARAYYAQAADDAHEINEHPVAAIATGYAAKLALQEGPTIRSWLMCIEATAHADIGNDSTARAALDRAQAVLAAADGPAAVPWFHDHGAAHQAAVTGHVLLRASDPTAGRQLAEAAAQLAPLGPASRRALVLCLLDQAHAELHAGSADDALTTVARAADLMRHKPLRARRRSPPRPSRLNRPADARSPGPPRS
jgi:transcriptional regulator with XRE-family HTH domain